MNIARRRWLIQKRTAHPIAMMRRAIVEAQRAARMGEVPVGAAVYRGHALLAVGGNRRQTTQDPTAHAELIAMRRAAAAIGDWRLNQCTLIVTLEPCPMCAGTIVNARLDRLIYGAVDPKMGAVDSLYNLCRDKRLNHRLPVVGGVLAEACGRLLTEFFRARRQENRHRRRLGSGG